MSNAVARWCKSCDLCARCKPGPGQGRAPLTGSEISFPLERIAIDIVGPLPITRDGNEYIIVIGDYFSKWKEAYPAPNHTAQTVADLLLTQFICRVGYPLVIHTDQGREFESHLFSYLCEKLEVQKTRTAPYRPQSDGLVERYNRTLKRLLAMFVNSHRDDWDDHLPYLMMAYRATEHQSTKCTPNLIMFGREILCPVDLMFGLPPETKFSACPIEYVEWVQQAMHDAFELVRGNLKVAARRQNIIMTQN